MAVIVDTDVISFLLKKDSRASLYRPHLEGLPKIISFMTLAELRRWELQNNWGARRIKAAREFLDAFTVIHSDEELCEIWAEIRRDAHKYGIRLKRRMLGLHRSLYYSIFRSLPTIADILRMSKI